MKNFLKILLLVFSIFLILFISPLSIPFSKNIPIENLFENISETTVVYTDKYHVFEDNGNMKTYTWDLSQYPDKQSQIKELLTQYHYYNKKYKDIENDFTVSGAMSNLRLINNDTDIIFFNNTNKIVIGNSIYVICGGTQNAENLIKEIVEILKADV